MNVRKRQYIRIAKNISRWYHYSNPTKLIQPCDEVSYKAMNKYFALKLEAEHVSTRRTSL